MSINIIRARLSTPTCHSNSQQMNSSAATRWWSLEPIQRSFSGLIVGGISVAVDSVNQIVISACLISVAVIGYLASRRIPITKAADPALTVNWNVWTETWRIIRFAREKQSVFLSILGISWFWFFGSAVTLQIPAYTLDILNGSEEITTALLAAFAVGVGIGSLLCERMSDRRIELGLVPFRLHRHECVRH